jgi:hypothetical protein
VGRGPDVGMGRAGEEHGRRHGLDLRVSASRAVAASDEIGPNQSGRRPNHFCFRILIRERKRDWET